MADTAPRLWVHQLTTVIGGLFSFELAPGEITCLSGSSGSGKTLLLRALADLDVNEGEVALDGRSRAEFAPAVWRKMVAFLPAESRWWHERVGSHFDTPPAYLEALGLEPGILEQPVERCSTGERQRLALLRMLANEPRVLLLDEPTASLDAENTARAEGVIREYRAAHNAAVLWVSHDPRQISRVADRVLRIEDGGLREVRP